MQNQCRSRAAGHVEVQGRQRRRTFCDSLYLSPGSICPHGKGCWRFFTLTESARGGAAGSRWSGCASILTRVVGTRWNCRGRESGNSWPRPCGRGRGFLRPRSTPTKTLVGAKGGGRWRVRGSFLDGWRPALNELLALRDGEAVRQMDREDSSVERGAASALPYSVCSVISSAKGRGMCLAFRRGTGGCPLSRPCPARGSAAASLCRRFILPDEGLRRDGARYGCAPPTSWRWQQG